MEIPFFFGSWVPDLSTLHGIGSAAFLLLVLYLSWHYIVYGTNFPGPHVYPVVGNLPDVFKHFDRHFDREVEMLRTSPNLCYFTASPGVREIVTADPAVVEHILKDRFENYPKGPIFKECFKEVVAEGIFTSDGDEWFKQRKVASHKFSTNTIRSLTVATAREAVKDRLIPLLDKAVERQTPVDMEDIMLRFNFDNICRIGFGYDPASLAPDFPENAFGRSLDRAGEICMVRTFLPSIVWKTMRRLNWGFERELKGHVKVVREFAQSVIDQRRAELAHREAANRDQEMCGEQGVNGEARGTECGEARTQQKSDILSRMILLGEEDHSGLFSDSFLRDSCVSFIIAGRDTSALAVTWLLWLLTWHPEVEENIFQEVRAILAKRGPDEASDEILTFQELKLMTYTQAALNETLRLYPSVPTDFKTAASADVLPNGIRVGKGWYVTYAIYAMGRMTQLWGEDASEFRPQRWLVEDGSLRQESPFKFPAFNAGPRLCLGRDLAYLQMKLLVGSVVARYTLRVDPKHAVLYKTSPTLHMKNGLQVTVVKRGGELDV